MRRPTTSSALRRRRRRKNTGKKKKTWLDSKIIRGIRKMKLVGLRQALKPGILWIERLLWIGVFIFCVGVAVYLTVETVQEYSDNPTTNNFHDDEPIFKVPFPATTITGTSILQNNAIKDAYTLLYDISTSEDGETFNAGIRWTDHLLKILLFTIDHLCELANSFASKAKILDTKNPGNFKLKDNQDWVKGTNVTLYDNMNNTDLRDTVIPFLKNKTLDCEKIMAACFWEGTEKNCTEIFVPIQTDVGNGCSFNRIPDQILRKGQGLLSAFNNQNYTEEQLRLWRNFKLDSAMSIEGLRDFKELTFPRVQHNAGKLSGLSFMLIFDQDITETSCPIVDSYGYLIGIHSPFEDPRIMQTAVTVPPRHEVFIKVNAEVTIADKKIEGLRIEKRKCLFQSENPLRNFNVYTVGNCHQECLERRIQERCNCSLLTLSAGNNERLCGPLQVHCVRNTTELLENSGYDKQCRNPVCYSACTEIKYDADVSYLPYHQNQEFDFSDRKSLAINSLTSIVHITHGSNSVPTRERKLQLGFSILFGVIGGTWGTILEFSLFTLFNILAGLIVWLTPNCLVVDEEGNEADNPEPRGASSCSRTRQSRNIVELFRNSVFVNLDSQESEIDENAETRIQVNQETRFDEHEGTPRNGNSVEVVDNYQEIPTDDDADIKVTENSETPKSVYRNAPKDEFQEIPLDDYAGTHINEYEPISIDENEETAVNAYQVIPIDDDEDSTINGCKEASIDENAKATSKSYPDTNADRDQPKAHSDFKETQVVQDQERKGEEDAEIPASRCETKENDKTTNPTHTSDSLNDLWPKNEITIPTNSRIKSPSNSEAPETSSREHNCDSKDQSIMTGQESDSGAAVTTSEEILDVSNAELQPHSSTNQPALIVSSRYRYDWERIIDELLELSE